MKFLKSVAVGALAVVISLVPCFAWADEIPKEELDNNIVTEYNSADLTDPIIFDANETVAAIGTELDISARSVILMDVSTGEILYEKNSHERLAPASVTKVMGLLLTMEAIEAGQLTLDTVLSASEYACSMGGSQIWLEPGEQMSVHDLLKAAVIGSANDATVMLGEAIAGSGEGFVAMMNERASQLGLIDTNFINATGLDADGHYTSAHDVAVMSRELIKHELIKNYSTVWIDTLRNGESELVNTNKLVRFYEGCTGLKTGTTSKAGACLAATACRNGMELVAVVMGSPTSNDRFNGARKLLDYGFANWTTVKVCPQPKDLVPIKIKGGVSNVITPVSEGEKAFLLPKGKTKTIELVTELPEVLKAPIVKGQQIGVCRVLAGGEEIGTVKILAGNSVKAMTFAEAFKKLINLQFFM
ncbi:MAG: D-alanyl-D-alanine carboxypeptidase [Ruminococcaceae bacterium]|nr:D-alanyl-D-alanine carboxypeptidase [Oscillospiraceae bacterium]